MEEYSSDSSDGDSAVTTLNLSRLSLVTSSLKKHLEQVEQNRKDCINTLLLFSNNILTLPKNVSKFSQLQVIDLSYNGLKIIPAILTHLNLRKLILKNNDLNCDSIPKTFGNLEISLKELNLSGNNFKLLPRQILHLRQLKYLYLGSNQITEIPNNIQKLKNLQVLYLGGNCLTEIPASVGQLKSLGSLVLTDNQIENIPPAIGNLKKLRILTLNRNKIRTLPQEIIALKDLTELSVRDNPLVVRFVQEIKLEQPASLLELSARVVHLHKVPFGPTDLPKTLIEYLQTAHQCVNPQCEGVFFDNRVEHIKFVDFCGRYKIPLLQYLCSARCVDEDNNEEIATPGSDKLLRKVLLG